MRTDLMLLALLIAFCGCELISPDGDYVTKRSDSLSGQTDSTAEEEEAVPDTAVYVTGVSYPEGYFWQRDTAYGTVECDIVLFRNGELVMKVPVGDDCFTSSDMDMHRVAGGHIYTDYSTTSETVICMDGSEIFRYSGREMMRGFLVQDGDVYTLGLARSGTGVSYRCNGELLYEDEGVVPLWPADNACEPSGALYTDEGEIHFTLYDGSTYYSWSDGAVVNVGNFYKRSTLYLTDYRLAGGKKCRTVVDRRTGYEVMNPTLVLGYEMYYLGDDRDSHDTEDIRLVYSDGECYVKGTVIHSDTGLSEDRMWMKDGSYVGPGTDYEVYDFCVNGEDYAYAAAMDGELALIDHKGMDYAVDGRWRLSTRKCLALNDTSLIVALTPIDADVCPALWIEGEMTELPINGYLSSVVVSVE